MAKSKKSSEGSLEIGSMERKIEFKQRKFKFSEKQKQLLDICLNPETKIVFIAGPAGASKTYISIYAALNLLAANKDWDFTYIRSIAESGDKGLGSLPGTVEEKFAPFLIPLEDKLDEIITAPTMVSLRKDGAISAMPVNFVRGANWQNKIVSLDECFEDSIYIETDKGRIILKKILENPSQYKVLSFNEEKKSFEFKKILNTFSKGEKNISEVVLDSRSKIRATRNHRFLTNVGWKRLDELCVGDAIVSSSDNKHSKKALNNDQLSIVYGSILGDGNLQEIGKYSYRLRCIHSIKQQEYLCFKADCFQAETQDIEKNGFAQKPAIRFTYGSFHLSCEKDSLKKLAIDNLTNQSLAIAWQDDGYHYAKGGCGVLWSCATSEYFNNLLAEKLNSMGYSCTAGKTRKKDKVYFIINFRKEGFAKMAAAIAPYIHESMAYKVPEKYKDIVGTYKWNRHFQNFSLRVVSKVNLDIDFKPTFDLEIEDNHNFVVSLGRLGDGTKVVAHNCQNFSKKELVTLITRIGENCKIFFSGDLMQSDIRNSGFAQFIDCFDNEESRAKGIHVFKFDKTDIFRSEILKFIVEKIENMDKKV